MKKLLLIKSESKTSNFETNNELFVKNNIETTILPSLQFESTNLDLLLEKLKNPLSYSGLLFTSPRSALAIASALKIEDIQLPEPWFHLDNYCVGKATKTAIENDLNRNLPVKGEESGNAESLLKFITAELKGKQINKPFLFPCSNLRLDTLGNGLEEAGFKVDCIECYKTIKHESLDKTVSEMDLQNIDYIVFFSPSTVKFFTEALVNANKMKEILLDNGPKMIAIGPSTKLEMENLEIPVHGVCSKPNVESLIELLNNI